MSAILPFLTMIALAVMTGITSMHYTQVNAMVARDALSPGSESIAQDSDDGSKDVADTKSPGTVVDRDIPAARSHAVIGTHKDQRSDALLEILAEMRREQKNMRLQIAETNRDLAEANFRLDATSNDFRPLRTDSERPQSMDNSPGIMGRDIDGGVLPPKPK